MKWDGNMKPAIKAKKLRPVDFKAIFSFFETAEVDYPALRSMIARRFEGNNILSTLCNAFADNMESIEAGNGPVMSMQPMIAKSVLSLIITIGRIKAALIFLEAAVEKWDRERFREVHSMLTLSGEEPDRLDVVDRPWLDYQIYDRGYKTTMMLFCGLADRFGVEMNAVIPWLRSLPVNLVYIRDFNRLLYLAGIESLGNLDATISALKKDLAAIGTERTITMGNSGGVYGCLYYADLLQADGVLCFAGPTSLKAGVEEASERPVYERVQELVDAGQLVEPDLRQLYLSNGIPVRYFFGQDYQFDLIQSATFKDIANVAIEGLQNWERHIVIGEMARRDQLKTVLADAADVTLKGLNRAGTLVS
jgi:hypothetical protein